MKKLLFTARGKFLVVVASLMAGTSAFAGNITMPKPDYTDFYAGVAVVLGVSAVVMVAKRLKGFFR